MATALKKPAPPVTLPIASATEKVSETFSTPAAEIQENVRKALEKGVADTRAAYSKAKAAAEETGGALEASCATAAKGVVEFNAKALEALRLNAEANFDFLKSVKAPNRFPNLWRCKATIRASRPTLLLLRPRRSRL
jgi:hypothetical protein